MKMSDMNKIDTPTFHLNLECLSVTVEATLWEIPVPLISLFRGICYTTRVKMFVVSFSYPVSMSLSTTSLHTVQ